jgi:hypothetical protein
MAVVAVARTLQISGQVASGFVNWRPTFCACVARAVCLGLVPAWDRIGLNEIKGLGLSVNPFSRIGDCEFRKA